MDHGEEVLHPVLELAEAQLPLPFRPALLGDVLDREQKGETVVVGVKQLAGVEEHDAPTQVRELVLDLVALDRQALGDHRLEQVAQIGDVPLPIAELVERPADGLVATDLEGLEERAAGGHDAEIAVEHEQGLAHGVDDALRQGVACPQEPVEVFQVYQELRSVPRTSFATKAYTLRMTAANKSRIPGQARTNAW